MLKVLSSRADMYTCSTNICSSIPSLQSPITHAQYITSLLKIYQWFPITLEMKSELSTIMFESPAHHLRPSQTLQPVLLANATTDSLLRKPHFFLQVFGRCYDFCKECPFLPHLLGQLLLLLQVSRQMSPPLRSLP